MIWVELDGGVCYELGDDSFLLLAPGPWRLPKRSGVHLLPTPVAGPQGMAMGALKPAQRRARSVERRRASRAAHASGFMRLHARRSFALRSSPPLAPPGGLAPAHAALALLLLSAKLPVGPGPEDPLQGRAEAEQKQKRRRGRAAHHSHL